MANDQNDVQGAMRAKHPVDTPDRERRSIIRKSSGHGELALGLPQCTPR